MAESRLGDIWPLQLRYIDEPWKVLAVCVLLNKAKGTVAEKVAEKLFENYPSATRLLVADEVDLMAIVRALGLGERRARTLKAIGMNYAIPSRREEYESGKRPVDEIPGIGDYGRDAYGIFVLDDFSIEPSDKALAKYLEDNQDD